MADRLTKFNEETGEYEYRERAKTQEEFNAQRKAVIQRLGEFEDKIEQGKLLELPCKIGDEKFAILPNTDVIVKGKVCVIIWQNGFLIDFGYNPDKYGGYSKYTQLLLEELFDTYEEAEAKLREMEGIDNEKTDK